MDPAVNTAVSEIGAILSRLTLVQGKAALEEAWRWYIGGDRPVVVEDCDDSARVS